MFTVTVACYALAVILVAMAVCVQDETDRPGAAADKTV